MAPTATLDDRPLHIDFERREVTVDHKPIDLTSNEQDLLSNLVLLRGETLSHERIEELVPEYAPKTACVVRRVKLGSGLGMIAPPGDNDVRSFRYYDWCRPGADGLSRTFVPLRPVWVAPTN